MGPSLATWVESGISTRLGNHVKNRWSGVRKATRGVLSSVSPSQPVPSIPFRVIANDNSSRGHIVLRMTPRGGHCRIVNCEWSGGTVIRVGLVRPPSLQFPDHEISKLQHPARTEYVQVWRASHRVAEAASIAWNSPRRDMPLKRGNQGVRLPHGRGSICVSRVLAFSPPTSTTRNL